MAARPGSDMAGGRSLPRPLAAAGGHYSEKPGAREVHRPEQRRGVLDRDPRPMMRVSETGSPSATTALLAGLAADPNLLHPPQRRAAQTKHPHQRRHHATQKEQRSEERRAGQ